MNVYKTRGVCSRSIEFELDGDTIKYVKFNGGCNGNTKGIAQLVAGMKVDDVIARLEGTTCGFKPTSCPDQLAKALKEIKALDPAATVVMCSAMGQEAMVMDSIKSGAKDFIVKPFKPERILSTIKKILG